MKITIFCDDANKEALDGLSKANPQIKRVYIYEAVLSHALVNLPEKIVTTRTGYKVPAGMTIYTSAAAGAAASTAQKSTKSPAKKTSTKSKK